MAAPASPRMMLVPCTFPVPLPNIPVKYFAVPPDPPSFTLVAPGELLQRRLLRTLVCDCRPSPRGVPTPALVSRRVWGSALCTQTPAVAPVIGPIRLTCDINGVARSVSCQNGHQTFSWLGRVCRFMYAAELKESADKFSVANVRNMNNDVLLPFHRIEEYCRDGDTVKVIITELALPHFNVHAEAAVAPPAPAPAASPLTLKSRRSSAPAASENGSTPAPAGVAPMSPMAAARLPTPALPAFDALALTDDDIPKKMAHAEHIPDPDKHEFSDKPISHSWTVWQQFNQTPLDQCVPVGTCGALCLAVCAL